jgi:hypothetical protein
MPTTHSPLIIGADAGHKPSLFRTVGTKASQYHAQIPYLHKLPFPAIAIIVTLIVVNLLVWAAVGIVLVRQTFDARSSYLILDSTGIRPLCRLRFSPIHLGYATLWMQITFPLLTL